MTANPFQAFRKWVFVTPIEKKVTRANLILNDDEGDPIQEGIVYSVSPEIEKDLTIQKDTTVYFLRHHGQKIVINGKNLLMVDCSAIMAKLEKTENFI